MLAINHSSVIRVISAFEMSTQSSGSQKFRPRQAVSLLSPDVRSNFVPYDYFHCFGRSWQDANTTQHNFFF
jgi:hypothetical protein